MRLPSFRFSAITTLFLLTAGSVLFSCKKDKDTNTPNNPDPDVTVEKLDNPLQGHIFAAPFSNTDASSGKLLILDEKGNVLETHKTEAQALNFEKWNINGNIRYTYVVHDVSGFQIPGVGYMPGYAVVTDEHFNEINRFYLKPYNSRPADPNVLDSHDFILLDDNHYIAEVYYQKTVTNIPSSLNPAPQVKVVDPIIQEVKDGQVTWEWDAADHPELYGYSVEGNHYYRADSIQDYAHLNSMIVDPRDNNLILSFRNLNMIMKVNRQTGDIMWKLGGADSDFPEKADQKSVRQHDASLTDSGRTLLVFDNGQIKERPQTRVLEYQLDENSKRITGFRATVVPTGLFSGYMGSAQKFGDYYFIGGGSTPYAAEFNYKTGKITFKMNLKNNSYRVFKYK